MKKKYVNAHSKQFYLKIPHRSFGIRKLLTSCAPNKMEALVSAKKVILLEFLFLKHIENIQNKIWAFSTQTIYVYFIA